MANEITRNILYLTLHLSNLEELILHLEQDGTISQHERETIFCEKTNLEKNVKFWDLLKKKDWKKNRNKFLSLLRQTNNGHCADEIEGGTPSEILIKKPKILGLTGKWWPEEQCLPNAFHERKLDNGIVLIEDLYKKLTLNNSRRSSVICQKASVSGLGGVGKTTLAKWFARHYQDLYDYIIWIDCGEGSLISSFTNLAKELNLGCSFPETLNVLSRMCFSKFQGFQSLFIFDNAECYQGPQGIRQVLPKLENIHSIITSRTREWESESADGQIPELQLDAFDTNESIIFLKNNLKGSELRSHDLIKEFCELLGNNPLALQIAIKTINSKKITLEDYLMRIKTTPDITNQNFDDYKKAINKTMKISLDLIKHHESHSEQIAYNILLVFGYILPYVVELDFFQAIFRE